MTIKGVVLAGGTGSRLDPLTRVTNKHLLPVFDQPMIYYPLLTLRDSGIENVLIVTGGNDAGDFMRLVGDGRALGLKHVEYAYQSEAGGIAQALALAEHFAGSSPICVMLGDNVLGGAIPDSVDAFQRQQWGARIHLFKVPHPERFGVARFEEDPDAMDCDNKPFSRLAGIEEKPKAPPSDLAVTGIYMYDSRVFSIIRTLRPSGRGELEITDVNNEYIRKGEMTWQILRTWWTDAGTVDSLLEASNLVKAHRGAEKANEAGSLSGM